MSRFEVQSIPPQRRLSIEKKAPIKSSAPVKIDRLSLVSVTYYGFDSWESQGELIVLQELAESVLELFVELHTIKFPIGKIATADEYGGDDVACMEANVSSAFNSRKVMGTTKWSSHAYGAAIDINPLQNPYVPHPNQAHPEVFPSEGQTYLNRQEQRPGMVESIVPIFEKFGFDDWGGNWSHALDYHHFQVNWERIRELVQE